MITLNASGSSVTFTFSGNSTYLNDGAITVPKNSLALIVDESDMVTFRKAASNDIFVSANIAEFGMTKDELMAWYKANMVGSTSGGGITSGEVQTMIDESISGKVDADFDNSLGFDINDDLGVYAEGNSEDIVFNTAPPKVKEYTFPSVYTNGSNNLYKVGFNSSVSLELNQSFSGTVSTTKAIGVKYLDTNDELKECWWDYSNNAFTINSDYSANNSVRLTYNSSSHRITLSRQNNSFKTIVTIMVGGDYYIASSSNPTEADCYISYIKIYTSVKKLQSVLNEKQRQLTAGDGIKLDYYGNISANIKVTGDTHTNVLNSESATTYVMLDGVKNVDMWLNQSYTGTPSGWYTIGVLNLDGSYDYYLYENDTFTFVYGSAGSTLNYDSSTGKVSITCPSGISSINNVWKFAPKDDLTNADCFIGLVSYTSNEYTIQDAIDNKVDTSDVTTAVTSGSTDVVTSGGVYEALGGMKIVKLTESEYAGLATKDPNVLYVVIPDPQYRWTQSGTTCIGYDKYQNNIKEQSTDGGATWTVVIPEEYSASTLIESQSTDCGYVPPTAYTYSITIQGLDGAFAQDVKVSIDWGGEHTDTNLGNGTYTYTTSSESLSITVPDDVDGWHPDDYVNNFTLTSSNNSRTVTYTDELS